MRDHCGLWCRKSRCGPPFPSMNSWRQRLTIAIRTIGVWQLKWLIHWLVDKGCYIRRGMKGKNNRDHCYRQENTYCSSSSFFCKHEGWMKHFPKHKMLTSLWNWISFMKPHEPGKNGPKYLIIITIMEILKRWYCVLFAGLFIVFVIILISLLFV